MRVAILVALAVGLAGCTSRPSKTADAGTAQPDAGRSQVVYSYVDDFGKIRMAARLEDVPEAYRDQVVITDTASSRKKRLGNDRILVVDLRSHKDGKPLNYSIVDLDALQRKTPPKREVRDPKDLGSYVVDRAAGSIKNALGLGRQAGEVQVILYSAPWCGFCKKAARHLEARGVAFAEKDIEADRTAAVELARKLRQANIQGGGVPVLDIGGTMVVGFNKHKIDRLLDENK